MNLTWRRFSIFCSLYSPWKSQTEISSYSQHPFWGAKIFVYREGSSWVPAIPRDWLFTSVCTIPVLLLSFLQKKIKKLLTVLFPYISYKQKQKKRTQLYHFWAGKNFPQGWMFRRIPWLCHRYTFSTARSWLQADSSMDLVARPGGFEFWVAKKWSFFIMESRQKNESRWWQLKDFWIFSPRSLGKMIQIDEKKIRWVETTI